LRVYRIFIHSPSAAPTEPGGVLFVPPHQDLTRIGNPKRYQTLYVGDSQAGVCAEVFNVGKYRLRWSSEMLRGRPDMPDSFHAIAEYEIDGSALICNLDDPKQLVAQSLRPSQIVTRDYLQSQAWALALFDTKRWCGASWWSYHDPRWVSMGLWSLDAIRSKRLERLTILHPALAEAASVLKIDLHHV